MLQKQALQSKFIDGYIAKKKQAPRARAALHTTHNMQSQIAARTISFMMINWLVAMRLILQFRPKASRDTREDETPMHLRSYMERIQYKSRGAYGETVGAIMKINPTGM
jgi:hypothetical protein